MSGKARSNAHSPTGASLPTTNGLSVEDDWTRIRDPKVKKRIQNRVAQRSYRHRIKARLNSLQTRLEYPEDGGAKKPKEIASKNPSSGVSEPPLPSNQMLRPALQGESSLRNPTDEADPVLKLLQPNFSGQHVEEADSLGFLRNIGPGNNLPAYQSLPQAQTQIQQSPGGDDQSGRAPDDLVLSYLKFQTHILDPLATLQEETNMRDDDRRLENATVARSLSQTEQTYGEITLASGNTDGIDLDFNPHADLWKLDPLAQTPQSMEQLPLPTNISGSPSQTTVLSTPRDAPAETKPSTDIPRSSNIPAKHSPLNERFEYVMERVDAAGFSNFDELVTAYYCGSFGESSPLANEQRLSRNRRLPQVIEEVFHAAGKWSAWERRGFQEAVLKTAEAMLISESDNVRSSLVAKISHLVEEQERDDITSTGHPISAMKKMLQDQLPNLWALTVAVAAHNGESRHGDRSYAALGTVLLLHCAGHLQNDQLLRLLGACL